MSDNYYAIVCPPPDVDADGTVSAAVCLSGEFDLGAGDDLRAAILGVVTGGRATSVVVDLTNVTFIDAASVGVLFDSRSTARRRHVEFRITETRGVVRRVLDVLDPTGVLRLNRPDRRSEG
ncbi:STAS domain-containing protein [Actinoplanes sp. TRM 88003]|uniref:STAS domain-containing protein n=1 Tax=Paractinoplanes aksuensis TaxID=2939490 RepID=A0ABT1DLJ8_9ACTN|nr:STAS domain-containing protein [Actinoplanes aksuensis]MCO8271718.1 STAS domain-containing protein [Actinoplanes aksuensis]